MFPVKMYRERIAKIQDIMEKSNIDAVILTSEPNIRYVSGYSAITLERMISLLIFRDRDTVIMIIPKLEENRAEENCMLENVDFLVYADLENPVTLLEKTITKYHLTTLGVEGVIEFRYVSPLLEKIPQLRILVIDNLIYSLRAIKDEYERDALKRVAEINNAIMREIIQTIKPGISEKALAVVVRDLAFERGVDEVPFTLIQSGKNSALPHQEPTSRVIQEDDVIILDIGIRFQGYFSDITRTIIYGSPSNDQLKVFDIVLKAQQNALKMINPGIKISEIDIAARRTIESYGYGEYFLHRTGHGIGLEIHEPPYIHSGNNQLLMEGMSFTIEPGIYLPGRFGIRLEDNITITEGQCINLTNLPKSIYPEDYL